MTRELVPRVTVQKATSPAIHFIYCCRAKSSRAQLFGEQAGTTAAQRDDIETTAIKFQKAKKRQGITNDDLKKIVAVTGDTSSAVDAVINEKAKTLKALIDAGESKIADAYKVRYEKEKKIADVLKKTPVYKTYKDIMREKGIPYEDFKYLVAYHKGNEAAAKSDVMNLTPEQLKTKIAAMRAFSEHVGDELSGGSDSSSSSSSDWMSSFNDKVELSTGWSDAGSTTDTGYDDSDTFPYMINPEHREPTDSDNDSTENILFPASVNFENPFSYIYEDSLKTLLDKMNKQNPDDTSYATQTRDLDPDNTKYPPMGNAAARLDFDGTLEPVFPFLYVNDFFNMTYMDQDVPAIPQFTNIEGERSPEAYDAVIDQFEVETNPRYLSDDKTYCNYYVWDVTGAMGAEVPHYIDKSTNMPFEYDHSLEKEDNIDSDVGGLRANRIYDYMIKYGEDIGYREITPEEAQERANQGYPTFGVIQREGHGHVVMIRPNYDSTSDEIMISQAGRNNYNNIELDGISDYKFYTHD